MAKAKKEKPVEEEIISEQPIEQLPEEIELVAPVPDVMEQEGVKNPIYVPDIPAQMIEQPKKETEIEFLYRILQIQSDGGFGRHLDQLILQRIKSLR